MTKKVLFLQNPYVKSLTFLFLLTGLSLFGYGQAFGYGGGGGGGFSPSTPASVSSVNVPLTVSATQAGTVTQTFSDSSQAQVSVPKGAVEGQTTFEVSQGELMADNTPSESAGAFMVEGSVFNISAVNIENQAISSFSEDLSITLTIPNLPADTASLGVYYFMASANEWVLMPGAEFNPDTGTVSFNTNHLTIFAIIKAAGLPSVIKAAQAAEEVVAVEEASEPGEEPVIALTSYSDGTLMRGPNMRIYAIQNQQKKYISSLAELAKYKGQAIIDVKDSVIEQYADYSMPAAKDLAYADGSLLRGPDKKVYVIKNGQREYIPTLAELLKYAGREILDVNNETLIQYAAISGAWQIGEGSLIRGSDYRVYRVENGQKRYVSSLEELRQYAGQEILNVDAEVMSQY